MTVKFINSKEYNRFTYYNSNRELNERHSKKINNFYKNGWTPGGDYR